MSKAPREITPAVVPGEWEELGRQCVPITAGTLVRTTSRMGSLILVETVIEDDNGRPVAVASTCSSRAGVYWTPTAAERYRARQTGLAGGAKKAGRG